ncbi:protein kinase [Cyanothece sp. BG0011]|uniref:protein kinase domain-containing protein n=1 Tax=Cyanothece sp. BG0011 TaxID=2082950 RepID=UPI000D1E4FD7|nr:protein kinase [Cyanothece sp. BG0011]
MTGWNAGHQLDNGRYTIEKAIGDGGFGLTYLGQDSKGNDVVIKTINEEEIPKNFLDKIRRDFADEAINLAKCHSFPHIVNCIGFVPDSRFPCIVMEYIPGDNIEDLMKKKGTLLEAEALTYIRQVAEGLKGVHGIGIFKQRTIKHIPLLNPLNPPHRLNSPNHETYSPRL